jgi:hypothetical protein
MSTTTNPHPDPLTVACSICGAPSGQPCRDRRGPVAPHIARADLAQRRQQYAAELRSAWRTAACKADLQHEGPSDLTASYHQRDDGSCWRREARELAAALLAATAEVDKWAAR